MNTEIAISTLLRRDGYNRLRTVITGGEYGLDEMLSRFLAGQQIVSPEIADDIYANRIGLLRGAAVAVDAIIAFGNDSDDLRAFSAALWNIFVFTAQIHEGGDNPLDRVRAAEAVDGFINFRI